jgi:hypothetical protein
MIHQHIESNRQEHEKSVERKRRKNSTQAIHFSQLKIEILNHTDKFKKNRL